MPEYPPEVYRLARRYGVSPGYVFRVGFEEMRPVLTGNASDEDTAEEDEAWELDAYTWTHEETPEESDQA